MTSMKPSAIRYRSNHDEEENEWFIDYTTGMYQSKKSIEGSPLNIKDTLTKIEWKLINENMTIAGLAAQFDMMRA